MVQSTGLMVVDRVRSDFIPDKKLLVFRVSLRQLHSKRRICVSNGTRRSERVVRFTDRILETVRCALTARVAAGMQCANVWLGVDLPETSRSTADCRHRDSRLLPFIGQGDTAEPRVGKCCPEGRGAKRVCATRAYHLIRRRRMIAAENGRAGQSIGRSRVGRIAAK